MPGMPEQRYVLGSRRPAYRYKSEALRNNQYIGRSIRFLCSGERDTDVNFEDYTNDYSPRQAPMVDAVGFAVADLPAELPVHHQVVCNNHKADYYSKYLLLQAVRMG